MMARYNAWQNGSIYGAADGLTDEARREDRGAFFGSIHATLSHLLWGDTMWMSRFDGWDRPEVGMSGSASWIEGWDDLRSRREAADARIASWADGLGEGDLQGELTWYSGVLGRETGAPKARTLVHFFNHQTHHRGQVHAMLTAAGATPGDTDLFLMPQES